MIERQAGLVILARLAVIAVSALEFFPGTHDTFR
jgi:hypothetical protein